VADQLAARQVARPVAVGAQLVQRGVEDARLHAALVEQERAQRIAQLRVVDDRGHHVARGAVDLGVLVGQRQAGDVGEPLAIAVHQLAATGDVVLEPPKPRGEQGCPRLVHAVVVAEPDDVVARRVASVTVPGAGRHRVRAQAPHAGRDLVVVGGEQAALAAGEHLVREEAEGPGEPVGPELALLADRRGAGAVRGVLDERDASAVAEGAQRRDVRGVAREVHRADRLGAGGDAARDVLGVEAEVVDALDLREDRLRPAVARRGRGRDKRDGGDDHLVAGPDARGEVGQVERRGAAREGDRVAGAQVLGEGGLELLGARPHRQPARPQRVRHGVEVGLLEAHVEQRDQRLVGGAHDAMLE
jgi:hypothetical protein